LQRKILGAVLAGAAIIPIYRIISVMLEQARESSASIQSAGMGSFDHGVAYKYF